MSNRRVIVVGLGPGNRASLTVEALEALRGATHLFVRSADHLLIDELRSRGDLSPALQIHAAQTEAPTQDEWLSGIVARALEAAHGESIVYAVPGHPLIDDRSTQELLRHARIHDVEVQVVAGLSRLETVAAILGNHVDLATVQVVGAATLAGRDGDAERGLAGLWTGPSERLLNAQAPLLVTQIQDAALLATVGRHLQDRYPSNHAATLVLIGDHAAAPHETSHTVPLAGLDSVEDSPGSGRVAALYVPALAPLDDARATTTLGYITARLRGPGGCPWDREQTHASLTPYMIEEAYEAVDAIERSDDLDMVEELGDVLLQVVLHSQLAEEEGRFSLADVVEEVNRKLVRRHPHVFGDVEVSGSSDVLRNWEAIKRAEKGERRRSVLDGIPPALPALALAQTIGRKAAKVGFDWPDVEGTYAKVHEELEEVRAATTDAERHDELGDLLYALSSVCRHLGIDAEEALRAATRKFAARFRRVEAYAQERGLDLSTMDLPGLDALWLEAKAEVALAAGN